MLTAWLDLEESGYKDGVPLGLVMDELGFKGDRSGLLDTSVVDDVFYHRDGLSFSVKDNFSEFNVCDMLAEKLGVPFSGSVQYRFSEGEDMEYKTDAMNMGVVYPTKFLQDRLEGLVSTLLEHGDLREDGCFTIHDVILHNGMFVDSVGPDSDDINFVKGMYHVDDTPHRCSVKVKDIDHRYFLDYLNGHFDWIVKTEIGENAKENARKSKQMRAYRSFKNSPSGKDDNSISFK